MIRVLVSLLAIGWSANAYAFTAQDKMAAIGKLSEARTVETYCPDLQIDKKAEAEAIQLYDLDLNSIEAKIQAAKKLAMVQTTIKKTGAKAWCEAMLFMYGPEGKAGRGLLIKK